jgi:hypothetical protein
MKVRLTVPVLLASLLLAITPAPGLAASPWHQGMSHCGVNTYPIPYPRADQYSSAPKLDGYTIPYPSADLDGDSHNCLAGGATRSAPEDARVAPVRHAVSSSPVSLGDYAIPYPSADLDGDSRPAPVRYALPYPRADWGDGEAYLVR